MVHKLGVEAHSVTQRFLCFNNSLTTIWKSTAQPHNFSPCESDLLSPQQSSLLLIRQDSQRNVNSLKSSNYPAPLRWVWSQNSHSELLMLLQTQLVRRSAVCSKTSHRRFTPSEQNRTSPTAIRRPLWGISAYNVSSPWGLSLNTAKPWEAPNSQPRNNFKTVDSFPQES